MLIECFVKMFKLMSNIDMKWCAIPSYRIALPINGEEFDSTWKTKCYKLESEELERTDPAESTS